MKSHGMPFTDNEVKAVHCTVTNDWSSHSVEEVGEGGQRGRCDEAGSLATYRWI